MAIQNLFTSRDNNLDGNTYVGQLGRLWYNPDTNSLYASDGATVGGIPVDLATGANILANVITVNTITSTSGTVEVTGNLSISGNISPAAPGKIGGIQPGPGVIIGNTGILTIDSSNLAFSFGNFFANNNILSIVNADEDMILATQGNAEIQLVGNIGFYRTNGLPPDIENRFFYAQDDGQITILVPNTDPVAGAVEIIGSASGESVSPAVSGVMLHVTGQPNTLASIYSDAVGNNSAFVGRRYNGTSLAPAGVLNGDVIMRVTAVGRHSEGFQVGGSGTLSFDALEDFTPTAQGTQLKIYTTAIGANTRSVVATVDNANGVTATRFTTTGNVVANNVLATGSVTSNSATAGVGYRTGAGGTVTQLNSKSDPVTLNTITGEITSDAALLSRGASVTFTLNNSAIANTDVMIINQVSATNLGDYLFFPVCNTGAANITIVNRSNKNNSDAIVMRYAIIRGARN